MLRVQLAVVSGQPPTLQAARLAAQINNRKTVTRDDLGNPFVNRNADAFDEVSCSAKLHAVWTDHGKARVQGSNLLFGIDAYYVLSTKDMM